jgi:DNA (cytosine-5)-methyltransferase 1
MSYPPLTAIDLFAGAGGLSLGLVAAGFRVLSALDSDSQAVETYKANIGPHAICRDIASVGRDDLLSGRHRSRVDLVAGGPPCQGFSIKRGRDPKDSRNSLLFEFLRIVAEVQPRFFLIENVPGLVSRRGRRFLDLALSDAASQGYHCHVAVLNAAAFGVPQLRERAFVVGERPVRGRVVFEFPRPTLAPDGYQTVRDSIGNLPSPPEDGKPHSQIANHYREARLSATNRERLLHIPPGGGRENLPSRLRLRCHQDTPRIRHVDTYGRLAWDEPAVTLTARFDSFTRGRFAHPEEHRTITLREGARIQTFPDHFVFIGNREQVARQIGNAVPPLLAKALGRAIAAALRSRRKGTVGRNADRQKTLWS